MHYPTLLHEYFDISVKRHPNKEALIFEDQRYTYSDIYNQASLLAHHLIKMGVKRQDRVLIYMDNAPEIVISLYAILKAGGIFTIINSAVQVQKLSYILKDCRPSVIIAESKRQDRVLAAMEKAEVSPGILWTGPQKDLSTAEKKPASSHWEEIFSADFMNQGVIQSASMLNGKILDLDLAGLIYTSGSTGEPKGVMESHANIIAAAHSIIQYLQNTPDDIILNTLPLSFDYGLYQVIMTLMFGGTLILEKSFIFLTRILSIIGREKITGFPIVPTIVAMILKTIDLKSFNLESLRYITNTGAAFPAEHIKKLRTLIPWVQIYSMFGLTECKRIAYLPPEYIDSKPESVGIAMPNCEVFILDEQGRKVRNGEVGELVVRGSNVMQGYWNAPEQTSRTFRQALGYREKLLFTGDYFRMDGEGFLYFLGRKDDMIKSRGERISAREVENILLQMEGIAECVVIGVDDEILGQAIQAFIVQKPGASMNAGAISRHCAAHLEPYAIPKHIKFVDQLPQTPHGKIDKKALKDAKHQTMAK
jgi:amino acid adenylation domain-containing protein